MVKLLLHLGQRQAAAADISAAAGIADVIMLPARNNFADALSAAQKAAAALVKGQRAGAAGQRQSGKNLPQETSLPVLALPLPLAVLQRRGGGAAPAFAAGKADIMFCFSAAENSGRNGNKIRQAVNWPAAAAFAARHESFLLLPCGPEIEGGNRDVFRAWLLPWLQVAGDSGFKGIFLAAPALPVKSRMKFISLLGDFLQLARNAGLRAGIIGGLQPPDIPRLLPYTPDYLGFSSFAAAKSGDSAVAESGRSALIRSLIPQTAGFAAAGDQNLGTDKILVTDFIVPAHIGAYTHEKGAPQPVCFNIVAEIARVSRSPHSMSHVFSYDIILDAVERLATIGHIELVESLAEQIAAFLLGFPQVMQVTVRVEKLNLAPKAVGVEITRRRQN